MAVAWVKKRGTTYINDEVFVKNFFKDFTKTFKIKNLKKEDFDFSEIKKWIEKEKELKFSLTKEEKKKRIEQRKIIRIQNKERYGYAIIDGVKTQISSYIAEPSCIFMGRGKHPLRGHWKKGPLKEDIELNLSPNAPRPIGNWKTVLWEPDVMWIARWKDKLSGKIKYIWLSETSTLKQKKDIEKFDNAGILRKNFLKVRKHILNNLDAEDEKRRKTATICFLIDKLKIRVGDEKDPDEADTIGASTLRSEHIRFKSDGKVIFTFLGKDSIPHVIKEKLPEKVLDNLKEFSTQARSSLFEGVDSKRVNEFLGEVLKDLSAKVFRTAYATETVEKKLKKNLLNADTPDYLKKFVATMANLEAAKVCNHRRTIPKTWKSSLEKKEKRLKDLIKRNKEIQKTFIQKTDLKEKRFIENLQKKEEQLKNLKKKLRFYQRQLAKKQQLGKPIQSLMKRLNGKQKAIIRQKQKIKKLKKKHKKQKKKDQLRLNKKKQRGKIRVETLRIQINTKRKTRDYNLITSLKSYIDPRIYNNWGKKAFYDWKKYYPKTLKQKFSWVDE
jgi:DNA topoisomerase-1